MLVASSLNLFTLLCGAVHYCIAFSSWKMGNDTEAITTHDNYQISHFASQDDITTSTLTVSLTPSSPIFIIHRFIMVKESNKRSFGFSDLGGGRGPVW